MRTMCVKLGVAVVKLHLALGRGLPACCMVHTPLGPLRSRESGNLIPVGSPWWRMCLQAYDGLARGP